MFGNDGDSGGDSQLSPWEELTMLSLGATAAAAVLTVVTWHRLLDWLVDQGVLVPATQSPLVQLPAGDGVGLDAPRLAIAVAALVFAGACAVVAIRRHTERGERR